MVIIGLTADLEYNNINMNEINQLYESISEKVIEKVIALGGSLQDAKFLLTTAKQAHCLLLEKQVIFPKHWHSKKKKFALNNCWYQLLKYHKIDLAHSFYEMLYEKLTASSSRMDFINYLTKPFWKWRSRKLEERAIKVFKEFFLNFYIEFNKENEDNENYIFFPINSYITSLYENYILYYDRILAGELYEYTKKAIVRQNTTKSKEIENLFQVVFSNLLEKARKKTLKPRRGSLINFINGACFNQQYNKHRRKKKQEQRNLEIGREMKRLGKDKTENNFKDEIPKELLTAIQVILSVLKEDDKKLIKLRIQKKSSIEIAKIMEYKNANVVKTKWYKLKKKVQKKLLNVQEKTPHLYLLIFDYFSTISNLFSDLLNDVEKNSNEI